MKNLVHPAALLPRRTGSQHKIFGKMYKMFQNAQDESCILLIMKNLVHPVPVFDQKVASP
jgi:hypothetical protein